MTEQEVKDVVRKCGWSYLLRTRRGKRNYIYAARKVAGKREEKYIGALTSLEELTTERLKRILSCT